MESRPVRPRPIRPRKVHHDLDPATVPRHWLADSPVATHVVNGVSLLFPAGERFFVRSVHRFRDRIRRDTELEEQVRGFAGQEGRHAREHERHMEMLEAQGYEIQPFLDRYERALRRLERILPPAISLAGTTASEHYTAIMAEHAFTDDAFLSFAHPVMRDLLLWHAAEEIEHKAVAFDVLQRVSSSYFVRLAGLSVSTTFLAYWWYRATTMLLRQDGITRRDFRAEVGRLRKERARIGAEQRNIARDVFARGIREYLRPGFHPWDNDNRHLIEDFLARLDRALDQAA